MQTNPFNGVGGREIDEAAGKASRGDSFEADPYAGIRSAMSPEHAHLVANEITLTLGRMPAALVLHQLLNSPEMRQAALASLLGKAARRSVRVNGSDVSISAYMRLVSRLCRDVAEQSETEFMEVAPSWESASQQPKPAAVVNLAFLPHRCQPLSGASVNVDATSMNPGFLTTTGVTRDSGLQAIVDRRVLARHPVLRKMRFALVDLTGPAKLASPQFAGHSETEQGGLGSMAKLACMYGAYQLKFDLEELSRQKGLTAQQALFDAARALWNEKQKRDPGNVGAVRIY